MSELRALIIDDERAARARIRNLLEEEPDVVVAGEADSGREAIEAVGRLDPDVLFLDVQMPELDGLDVLECLLEAGRSLPAIVFVTAYDRYAVRAFEIQAVDYLLKPFDDQRFREAVGNVRRQFEVPDSAGETDRLRDLLDEARQVLDRASSAETPDGSLEEDSAGTPDPRGPDGPSRLSVTRGDRLVLLDFDDVTWIEAAGDYVRLHTRERSHLLRKSMNEMVDLLGDDFARIHRSSIVRLGTVEELVPRTHGDYDVILSDGTELRLSRSYRRAVAEALGISL